MATRYAIIENNLVTNIVVAEPDYAVEQGWIEAPDRVDIGWTYAGGFSGPPFKPEPFPETVTPLQAELVLIEEGKLDEAKALVDSAGAEAQAYWNRAQTFRIDDPYLNMIGASLGYTNDGIRELFRRAALK